MTGPAYIVMPVHADGTQYSGHEELGHVAERVASSLQTKNEPAKDQDQQPKHGPLKEILVNQESLYKFISWEDPIRTISSYIIILCILLGAHYVPLTQLALRAGAFTFGVISVTEFANRFFGPNTVLSRLRPKEYKRIPEPVLNGTLKDFHDLIQYLVVQAQRIILGQDLSKAFVAFVGFTAVYWLIQVVSPFWLLVLGLTSIYIVPLVSSSSGRDVANDVMAHGEHLMDKAKENGKAALQGGRDTAVKLSASANEKYQDMSGTIGNVAYSAKDKVNDTLESTAQQIPDIREKSGHMAHSAKDTVNNAVESASQQIPNVRDKAGNVAQSAKSAASKPSETSSQATPNYNIDRFQTSLKNNAATETIPLPVLGYSVDDPLVASKHPRKPVPTLTEHVDRGNL